MTKNSSSVFSPYVLRLLKDFLKLFKNTFKKRQQQKQLGWRENYILFAMDGLSLACGKVTDLELWFNDTGLITLPKTFDCFLIYHGIGELHLGLTGILTGIKE